MTKAYTGRRNSRVSSNVNELFTAEAPNDLSSGAERVKFIWGVVQARVWVTQNVIRFSGNDYG